MRRFISKACKSILSAMGLATMTACPAMYGVPHANYVLQGRVTDENGKPIEGIKVDVGSHHKYTDFDGKYIDRVDLFYSPVDILTGKDGRFSKSVTEDCARTDSCTFIFTDIDGEANGGKFVTDTVDVRLERTKKGNGAWYEGTFSSIDPSEFKLKKEE